MFEDVISGKTFERPGLADLFDHLRPGDTLAVVRLDRATCVTCHQPPYYTDNLAHNLKTERFYKPRMINGVMATADGPLKTFPLRGIKDSPPYLHDARLLGYDRVL